MARDDVVYTYVFAVAVLANTWTLVPIAVGKTPQSNACIKGLMIGTNTAAGATEMDAALGTAGAVDTGFWFYTYRQMPGGGPTAHPLLMLPAGASYPMGSKTRLWVQANVACTISGVVYFTQ